jgi:small-conductance mechanosensitive channel
VAAFFWWIASLQAFWLRLSPNTFVAELVSQAVRVAGIVLALVLALNLTGAGALLGTVAGAAGVIGLAIGIAVRDSLENYISSIMLSLRQPFRANDHVVIDDQEGKVVRLTSRATILMTLDGNHLRIPNAAVFKAVILNYTRNPERRFTFQLGVDAADDPQAAIDVGTTALAGLDFVLGDPQPRGIIESVGDSNIMLTFHGWINQVDADFLQARSAAIRVVKSAIEKAGFTLPEPIYRLRFDQLPEEMRSVKVKEVARPVRSAGSNRSHVPVATASIRPQTEIDDKIAAERAEAGREDLLDPQKPVE